MHLLRLHDLVHHLGDHLVLDVLDHQLMDLNFYMDLDHLMQVLRLVLDVE
jgi:hypothetical protein